MRTITDEDFDNEIKNIQYFAKEANLLDISSRIIEKLLELRNNEQIKSIGVYPLMSLNDLVRTKFILKDAIKSKIQDCKKESEQNGMQRVLFKAPANEV